MLTFIDRNEVYSERKFDEVSKTDFMLWQKKHTKLNFKFFFNYVENKLWSNILIVGL